MTENPVTVTTTIQNAGPYAGAGIVIIMAVRFILNTFIGNFEQRTYRKNTASLADVKTGLAEVKTAISSFNAIIEMLIRLYRGR